MKFTVLGGKIKISFFFLCVVTFALILDKTNTAVITLCAAIFHELGHIFCLLIMGEKPRLVSFEPYGLRLSRCGIGKSYKKEIIIALAGPCANIFLALILLMIEKCWHVGSMTKPICINIAIAIFNLLPIEPLDAGNALFFALCDRMCSFRAGNIIITVGILMLIPITICGVYVFIKSGYNITLLLSSLYLSVMLLKKRG